MNLLFLPYFVSGLSFILLPITLVLTAIYLLYAYRGFPASRTVVDLTRVFHYGLAYFTYAFAFLSLVTVTQSLFDLYLGIKSSPYRAEGFPSDLNPSQFVRRDLADGLSIFVISALAHFYSYRKLFTLRQESPKNPHDQLLHKLYLLGLLPLFFFFLFTASFPLLSGYFDLVTGALKFSPDALRKISVELWGAHGTKVVLSSLAIRYNIWKLKKLGVGL